MVFNGVEVHLVVITLQQCTDETAIVVLQLLDSTQFWVFLTNIQYIRSIIFSVSICTGYQYM